MKTDTERYDALQRRFSSQDDSTGTLHYHPETLIPFDELGRSCGERFPYAKTLPFESEFIDQAHAFYASLPLNGVQIDAPIEGSLRPADALKIYEMAYFCDGPILELGTFRGLSTSIMSKATKQSGKNQPIWTIDLSAEACRRSQANLTDAGLSIDVGFIHGNAVTFAESMREAGFKFGFVFVDHSHAYEAVLGVARILGEIISPEGFALFHDYQDKRNIRDTEPEYGVAQGVLDGLSPDEFEFVGCYGCASLWRRLEGRG